ncbi:hypothetical protein SAMN04487891_101505 [Flagellimonas taeanensis]|uniref:Uncharacterized protein n=1 Tax=Flagellimonas taeanensis TaxID=1005926 RepID=A0A1M6QA85_9FLAO|nr:hypothetical protein [Allomuricauda taeanensis]SFB69818.1 hypothetical protein SAMN04487891_101505 [Allomuricauda taeanensis]SHK17050.1 hypothetical protein SAMN05216293_0512 [Allomuricauda taeanensis]
MNTYQDILAKLESFTKRYYTKQLIKGTLLFLSLGLLFWIAVMSLEFLLWLNQGSRLALFWLFVLVELFLLYRFIVVPLMYLFRIRKGIGNKEASQLIGKHFSEVDDKLYNLLELSENPNRSDLLLASIEQRSMSLGTIPFSEAINFKESYRYAKYIIIPLVLLGFIWVTGNIVSFFNSYNRVVNYDLAYERPAPFAFKILNERLEVLDSEPLRVKVAIEGNVRPESVYMVVDGKELLLKQEGDVYSYTFEAPVAETSFYLTANGWDSQSYTIKSYATPALLDFEMQLDFPKYLNRISETVIGTGNATIPEGTKVSWKIEGQHIGRIDLTTTDTIQAFSKDGDTFSFTNRLFSDFDYELSTANEHVSNFERLAYSLDIVKDASATVRVEQILDSLNPNQSFYTGQAADDYGIQSIRLVCFPSDDSEDVQRITLERPSSNVHQFYYTFPSGLQLEPGRNYKIYFEVVDNDGIRGGKITKSQTFSTTFFDDNQLKNKELEFQNSTLSKMGNSLEKFKEQEQALSKLNQTQKEEKALRFEDKNQIKDFLQKQQQQEELMKKFSNELKESIGKNENSEMKKLLQERLERQEMEAKKNAALLDELNKLADKINKEELQQRLEELGKNQGKNTRNLEQILELTKRYYVTEKVAQIAKELDKLSEKQNTLSELKLGQDFSDKEQQKLNEDFDQLEKEIREVEKDNEELKKPVDINTSKKETDAIKQDQKDALDEINKQQGNEQSSQNNQQQQSQNNASKKQKSAAQKMKEMSQALQQSADGGGGSSDSEDAEMLRQILDNLVTFSFKQENLFDNLQSADVDISQFSKTVKDQQNLRRLFEHVDDSLFALSLRRVELSEFVNEQIAEVYYNIDKSLESIAENQIYQGASYQQYVVNATNALADFLANILDNMQQNMGSGQGGSDGQDFQLPDIIKGQQSIQEKMNGEGQQGSNPEEGGKQQGSKGEGKEQGEDGKANQNGQEGQNGEGNENGSAEGSRGNGTDEMGMSEVYEIYKEQQYLREKLEEQLQDMIRKEDQDLAKKLLLQMEDFENDLLENGITDRNRTKANNIQHQLMKLENASMEQGMKEQRESTGNKIDYTNPITTKPELLKDYQNDIEILNRQALPLRQNFEKKVKVYFNNDRVPL